MSPKFAFGILLPAVLIVVLAIFLKQHVKTVSPAPVTSAAPAPAPSSEVSALPATPPPAPAPAPVVARAMTPEEIQAEKDHLQGWEMNNDPQSLSNILADLKSPEKDVRMAAIDATVQFDDTNAVPILRNTATNTEDLDEKVALLKAADFLALPDVTIAPIDPSAPSTLLTPEQQQAAQQRHDDYEAHKQARLQQMQQNNGRPGPSSQPPQQ